MTIHIFSYNLQDSVTGELTANSVIHNRYVIESHLGRGGMSDVYRAIQKELNRPVALKVMRSDTAWDKNALARFKQEALSVAKLEHPNIVPVYDYGEYEGNPFMVFRFVGGGSIKQHMTSSVDPALVLHWIRQISSALDYAHSKGVVHRDLKPDNVLMSEDGTLLLSDFGIAKLLEDDSGMTKTGSGFGTPHYLSPEQALGKKVDHRTDIYALGIMLFQMLTGRLPFNADTSYGVVVKHATEPVPRVGSEYDSIIQKVCAKNPDERYQTCGALVSDLQKVMQQAGVNVGQVTVPVVQTAQKPGGTDDDLPTFDVGAVVHMVQQMSAPVSARVPVAAPVSQVAPVQAAPVQTAAVQVQYVQAPSSGGGPAKWIAIILVVGLIVLAGGGFAVYKFVIQKNDGSSTTSSPTATSPVAAAQPAASGPTITDAERQNIESFIHSWQNAWQSRDINAYGTYYADDFYSQDRQMNRAAWIADKEKKFADARNIAVTFDNVQITKTAPQIFRVTFTQRYRAEKWNGPPFADVGTKTMDIRRTGSGYRIVLENWVPQ